jgi:hypothetical protein
MLRCYKPVTNCFEPSHSSSHVFAATLVSFWLTLCQTNAQSRETAFGQIYRSAVPSQVDRFSISSRPGEAPLLFLWSQNGSVISSAPLDTSGIPGEWSNHYLSSAVDDFMIVDLPFESKRMGVGIERTSRRLSFYPNLSADTLRASSVLQLALSPGRIVFGDINNDKRTDFIVFDRESPGAMPYYGMGNEKFRPGKLLAPDNAVGDLKLVHLNNDSLLDIVLYDWVRSEIHLLYGVGQGKFLDQATIPVEGEVRDLNVATLVPRGNLDIILSCRRPAKVEILQGDGLGDFRVAQRLALKEPFLSTMIGDVNGDGFGDIVGLDTSSVLHAFLNSGDNTFEEHLDFVVGRKVEQFALGSGSDAGNPDAFCIDNGTRQLISLRNAQRAVPLVDSVEFATGERPRGTIIGDVNGDGLNDLALVTGISNTIAFYLNRGKPGIIGQMSYSLPEGAHDLAFYSLVDSTARFLISHTESNQVSSFALDERERTTTNATIGTERGVEFLYWDALRSPAVDFFCFSPSTTSTASSLTLFEEIESHQFIERSFRLSPSNTLLGAGVGLLNRDTIPDVAYVYRNNLSGKYELAVSPGDSLYTFRQKSFTMELPDKNITRTYVWVFDLDHAGRSDVLILNAGTAPIMERLHHTGENLFGRLDTVANDIRIVDRQQVQFADLDGDGVLDIIVNDAGKGAIGWLRGARGSFEAFRPLCSVPMASHFAVGDLNGDGVPDLAVTLSETGVVRLYDGKRLLRRSIENAH